MKSSGKRWLLILGGTTALLLICGFTAFKYGLYALKGEIQNTLGPNSEVNEIKVGLTGIEITGIRIHAAREQGKASAWPTEDELRADRVVIVPSFSDLLSAKIRLQSIEIDNAYISILRATNGKVRLLPSLLEKEKNTESDSSTDKATDDKPYGTPVSIEKIVLKNGAIDFVDYTTGKKAVKLQMENIDVALGKIQLPELTGQTSVDIKGTLKGNKRNGSVAIKGNVELASYELGLTSTLRGVDLIPFQPYLLRATDSGIKSGTLDLDLNSSVRKGILRAPGTITLQNLELAAKSQSGIVMGFSQNALLNLMKSKSGKITVHFVLEGNINDPKFSLNENLASKFGLALADTLGVSIEGLTQGVRGAGDSTIKGVGEIFKKLNKK